MASHDAVESLHAEHPETAPLAAWFAGEVLWAG
jgi:hypothetical protein